MMQITKSQENNYQWVLSAGYDCFHGVLCVWILNERRAQLTPQPEIIHERLELHESVLKNISTRFCPYHTISIFITIFIYLEIECKHKLFYSQLKYSVSQLLTYGSMKSILFSPKFCVFHVIFSGFYLMIEYKFLIKDCVNWSAKMKL